MIDELKKAEEPLVFQLLKQYFNAQYKELNPFEKILIYKDTEVAGLISYSILYERAELNYILVLPDYRNNCIASLLMKTMLSDLIKNKVKSVTLEVNENNIPAIQLYKKYGFQKISIRKKYYGNEDALLLQKELR
jgi:ribosomal-protein-alanine acetyltransferase